MRPAFAIAAAFAGGIGFASRGSSFCTIFPCDAAGATCGLLGMALAQRGWAGACTSLLDARLAGGCVTLQPLAATHRFATCP